MSITFHLADVVSTMLAIPCDVPGCNAAMRCGYCRDGEEWLRDRETPELNMATDNAVAILSLLGQDTTNGYGIWEVPDLAGIRQQILKLRAVDKSRQPLIRDLSDYQGTRVIKNDEGLPEIQKTCRAIDFGNTDEQTLRRLTDLEALLVYAQDHQSGIAWS